MVLTNLEICEKQVAMESLECYCCDVVRELCFDACLTISSPLSSLAHMQGFWWYKSGKYTAANIVMDTQRYFFFFLTRMNTVPIKRESSQLTGYCRCARWPLFVLVLKMLVVMPFVAPYHVDEDVEMHCHTAYVSKRYLVQL